MIQCTEVNNEDKGPTPSSKQTTAILEEIKIILKDQFFKFELSNNNRFDNIERQISINNDASFRLSERIFELEAGAKINTTKNEGRGCMLMKTHTLHTSHITELLQNNSLPGVSNRVVRGMPTQHNLLWIIIHTAAFFISTIFIVGAYNSWQSSPVLQSLAYTNVKDIPFPAITICEPLLLKEEYKRFEILKRCMSLENETSWLCNEEELNLLWISNDIYPIEYDLISMNESDRSIMRKLFNPIFGYHAEHVPVVRKSFNGTEYLKYIIVLGKEHVSSFRIYNIDFPDSHYHVVNFRSGSISPTILMAKRKDHQDGIHICQTINGLWQGPQERKTRQVNEDILNRGSKNESICNPTNMIEKVCKDKLLFTEDRLEIYFDDANYVESIGPQDDHVPQDILYLYEARESFERYIVFTHSCFDHPSTTNMKHRRLTRHSTAVSIVLPTFTSARKDLTEVDVSKRNCIFSFERKLSLFQVYTQKNCILECQINCTLSVCGCIPYKTAIFNSSFNICTKNKSDDCISKSQFFYWFEFKDKRCRCDCPSDCVSLTYDVELSEDGYAEKTILQVTYQSPGILSMFRYSVTSPAEFSAYSLGILGTFNGFSVIMVLKILYGITLGLWTTVRKIPHTPYSK